MQENVTRVVNENNDCLKIGTASKGGGLEIHGNFEKPEVFEKKVRQAIEIMKKAQDMMEVEDAKDTTKKIKK